MPKHKKTAHELAEMILTEINVGGTFLKVHPDNLLGWRPTVVAGPQNTIALQKTAEKIAERLRTEYGLKI